MSYAEIPSKQGQSASRRQAKRQRRRPNGPSPCNRLSTDQEENPCQQDPCDSPNSGMRTRSSAADAEQEQLEQADQHQYSAPNKRRPARRLQLQQRQPEGSSEPTHGSAGPAGSLKEDDSAGFPSTEHPSTQSDQRLKEGGSQARVALRQRRRRGGTRLSAGYGMSLDDHEQPLKPLRPSSANLPKAGRPVRPSVFFVQEKSCLSGDEQSGALYDGREKDLLRLLNNARVALLEPLLDFSGLRQQAVDPSSRCGAFAGPNYEHQPEDPVVYLRDPMGTLSSFHALSGAACLSQQYVSALCREAADQQNRENGPSKEAMLAAEAAGLRTAGGIATAAQMAAKLSSQTSSIDEASNLIFQKCALYRLVDTLRSETWERIDQCRESSAHGIAREALLCSSDSRCSGQEKAAAEDTGMEAAPQGQLQPAHRKESFLSQPDCHQHSLGTLSQVGNGQERQQQHEGELQEMPCVEAQQLTQSKQTMQQLELVPHHSTDSLVQARCDCLDANLLDLLINEALTATPLRCALLQSNSAVHTGVGGRRAAQTSKQAAHSACRSPAEHNETALGFAIDGGPGENDLVGGPGSAATQGTTTAAWAAAAGNRSTTTPARLHWIREALILLRRVDDPQHVQLQRRKKPAMAPAASAAAASPEQKAALAPPSEDATAAAPTSMMFVRQPLGGYRAVAQRSSRILYAQWVGPGGGPWGGRSDTWHYQKRRFLAGGATAHSAIAAQMLEEKSCIRLSSSVACEALPPNAACRFDNLAVSHRSAAQHWDNICAACRGGQRVLSQQDQGRSPPALTLPSREVDEEAKEHEGIVTATGGTENYLHYLSEMGAEGTTSRSMALHEVVEEPFAAEASNSWCDFCPLRAEMLVLVLLQHLRRSDKHLSVFCNNSAMLVEARDQAFDSILAEPETARALTCAVGNLSRSLTIEDALASYMDLQLRRRFALGFHDIQEHSDDTWIVGQRSPYKTSLFKQIESLCCTQRMSENFLRSYARLLALRLLPDWVTGGIDQSSGCTRVSPLRRAPMHIRLERARAAAGCPSAAFTGFLGGNNSSGSEGVFSIDVFSEGAAYLCAVEVKMWDTLQRTFETRCPVPPEEQWRIRQALSDIAAARNTMMVYRKSLQGRLNHPLCEFANAPQLSSAPKLETSDCQQPQKTAGFAAESAGTSICLPPNKRVRSKNPDVHEVDQASFEALVLTKNAWEMHLPEETLKVPLLTGNCQPLLRDGGRSSSAEGLKIPQQLYVHLEHFLPSRLLLKLLRGSEADSSACDYCADLQLDVQGSLPREKALVVVDGRFCICLKAALLLLHFNEWVLLKIAEDEEH
ncbi:hypothetical protein Emag_007807 [Eimeria magna]